ncbi:nitroreductase [archaeon]|nr:nitroreductase [archaeon]|tara:strand:- start:2083 stop:2712 length:630 start_codon:yes stop_codon:yes gene_type:complete
MDLDKAIDNRFSCRSFLDKKIEFETLKKLFDSCIKSPTAGNLQDFRFIIVTDEGKKKEIAESCLKQLWMCNAPVLIVIASDLKNLIRFYEDRAEFYAVQDTAAAAQTLILKATDQGLGSNWISVFDTNVISRVLKLPDHVKPYVIVPLGYTKEQPQEKKRHATETFCHFNEYGNKQHGKDVFPILKYQQEKPEEKKNIFTILKEKFSKK